MEPRLNDGSPGRRPERIAAGIARRRRTSAREVLAEWLAAADIGIDGSRPWDLRVRDERLWNRILADGTLGLGEAYMDGWWDATRVDELVARALRAAINTRLPSMRET